MRKRATFTELNSDKFHLYLEETLCVFCCCFILIYVSVFVMVM